MLLASLSSFRDSLTRAVHWRLTRHVTLTFPDHDSFYPNFYFHVSIYFRVIRLFLN
jgi:hypothetical protein